MTKPDLDDPAVMRRAEKWIEENCPAGLDVDWSSADSVESEQFVYLYALYAISIPYSALLSQVRSKLNVTEKCDNSACSNALSGTSHENGVGRASR